MAKLNEMVKEFRLSINQSVEAFAMMLQISIEDYESLEADWIPSDEVLQHMCSLFEWNYNDIRHIANNQSPAAVKQQKPPQNETSPASSPTAFHHMLQKAREQVGQNTAGIATLLNISPEYYETFEAGQIPPDDLVRQICSLFSWNYRNVRQQLINHASPHMVVRQPPLSLKEIQSLPKKEKQPVLLPEEREEDSLAFRLRETRTHFGQTVSGIALLLNISEEYYEQLEAGLVPEPELLKRIASLFQWNYNELRLLVQNENIHQFQPTVTALNSPASALSSQLDKLLAEIKQSWQQIPTNKQELLFAQLEVLRDTAKRWQEPQA